jgi:hypothetical protein
MRLSDFTRDYVNKIPKFEDLDQNFSGEQLSTYFKK